MTVETGAVESEIKPKDSSEEEDAFFNLCLGDAPPQYSTELKFGAKSPPK